MKKDPSFQWRRPDGQVDLHGRRVAVVGGTGGIGRGLSRRMADGGARVTVVGRTFRDAGTANIDFVHADLELMTEAERIGQALPGEELDLVVFTTGIMAAPKRQETAEGLERDMAVSYLSRLVVLRNLAGRLGTGRPAEAARPRVFIYGYPGGGKAAHVEDLNFEGDYAAMKTHLSTVAGNEALVLDAVDRYPQLGVFGVNPGSISTNIRDNMFGEGSVKHRVMESALGVFTPDVDSYAARIVPLLVTPDLEQRSGLMFDRRAQAVLPSPAMTAEHVHQVIEGSERLLARVVPQVQL